MNLKIDFTNKKALIPYGIIAILVIYILMTGKTEPEVIHIPAQENEFTVENPVPEVRIDTIYKDSIQKVEIEKLVYKENPVNEELLAKYKQAMTENDSLKQLKLYSEAVTERNYKQVFEDSGQTITVNSEVIGTLKLQSLKYNIKPKTIIVPAAIKKPSFFVGGFTYMDFDELGAPVVGCNIGFMNKEKKKIFTFGYDTQKRVHFGINLKLF